MYAAGHFKSVLFLFTHPVYVLTRPSLKQYISLNDINVFANTNYHISLYYHNIISIKSSYFQKRSTLYFLKYTNANNDFHTSVSSSQLVISEYSV